MREYDIVPEFRYSKTFPFAAVIYQLVTIGFVVLGYYVTFLSYFLAFIYQFCAIYFLCLFICNRNYRLHITPDIVTVWNLFQKPRQHPVCQIRWKIKRIPWHNTYFVILYSAGRRPIAIVKPHWKNVFKIFQFPHDGPLTVAERKYMKFLKSVGLLY